MVGDPGASPVSGTKLRSPRLSSSSEVTSTVTVERMKGSSVNLPALTSELLVPVTDCTTSAGRLVPAAAG